jgi:hypothetical protein
MIPALKKIYAIENFTQKDVGDGKLNLDSVLSGELSGFVITDFLNHEEVTTVLNGFKNLTKEELIHINGGFNSYPMSFAQFEQMVQQNILTEKEYFDFSSRYIQNFKNKFGIDVHSKLRSLIGKISGAFELEIPKNPSGNGAYMPFTFRELFPGEGSLKAHCENLFLKEFPGFFERINGFSTPENQLSFFVVLQSPGGGGELTLFDILWNEEQKRLKDNHIQLETGNILAFDDKENLKRMYIQPPAGSLVVFSGGKIWHRVETILTSPSRITLGGFLSFSHDRKKLYSWS